MYQINQSPNHQISLELHLLLLHELQNISLTMTSKAVIDVLLLAVGSL